MSQKFFTYQQVTTACLSAVARTLANTKVINDAAIDSHHEIIKTAVAEIVRYNKRHDNRFTADQRHTIVAHVVSRYTAALLGVGPCEPKKKTVLGGDQTTEPVSSEEDE